MTPVVPVSLTVALSPLPSVSAADWAWTEDAAARPIKDSRPRPAARQREEECMSEFLFWAEFDVPIPPKQLDRLRRG